MRHHINRFRNYLARPTRDTQMILERIDAMDVRLVELKGLFDAYTAKVAEYVAAAEQHKTDVAKAVADAVAADDAEEAVDIDALKAAIEAAAAKVPAPPVPPAFEPSNNP